jgi:uncharacterized membrane protein YeiH
METIVNILEIIGIISFAAAGAMIAIDKETDIVGVVLMAIVTCFAGGMLRDVLAGNLIGLECPWFFSGSSDANLYIIISVATAVTVFLAALIFKKAYVREEKLVRSVNNVLDAIGIGVFAAIGTGNYLEAGAFVAIRMGVLTSVGGGLIRDIILNDIPFILRKYVYVVPIVLGSVLYYVIRKCIIPTAAYAEPVAIVGCVLLVFVIRMLATYFKWNRPKAIDFRKMRETVKREQLDEDNF